VEMSDFFEWHQFQAIPAGRGSGIAWHSIEQDA